MNRRNRNDLDFDIEHIDLFHVIFGYGASALFLAGSVMWKLKAMRYMKEISDIED